MKNYYRKFDGNKMRYSIVSFIFVNIYFLLLFNNIFVNSYYIIPFKYNRYSLSDLYNFHYNLSKDEVFLNYTNILSLSTYLKINNSLSVKGLIRTNLVCTSYKFGIPWSNLDFNIQNKHDNINISNIFDKIINNDKINLDEKNIYLLIGFGITQFNLSSSCISFIDEIKKNDNTVKSFVWSIKYYDIIDENNYDLSKYLTINNYIDEDSIYFPEYEKNQFGIQFNSVYFYDNNNNLFENIIKCNEQNSMEGFFDMNKGMIQSSQEYFELIKKNFFKKYLNSEACKIISFSKYSKTFVCEKTKLNVQEFYKSFPTLYFKNVDFNYIFELTSKDLFKEENDKLYFMIFSDYDDYKWVFGEIFLKKYYFTFNPDKKLIGFYRSINNKKIIEDKKDYRKTQIIIIIIGIVLIFINIIIFGLFLWKKKFGNERRKRANELNDDNYDYLTGDSDKNKIINEE